jgi:predicted TIM-barrel fold metal-dependent hydrolase
VATRIRTSSADISVDFGAGPLQDFKVVASRLPQWSPEASADYMDKIGKDGTAILSFPLLFAFPDDKGAAVARLVNDYAARLRDENPERFGFFAAIPSLHNTEAALAEISHAFNELHADGVVLLARYGDSYLGSASFEPVWAELNRHSAVVFVHPGTTFRSTVFNKYVDPAVAEFPHETTQTALDMIMNNTVRRNNNCKIILSHAGGTLPYLIGRASSIIPFFAAHIQPPPKTAEEIVEDAKLFYFDLALSSTPYVLDSLLKNFPKDRILCGSDYPFAPPPSTISLAQALDSYEMDDETREMIYWKNACAIMPRLRGR